MPLQDRVLAITGRVMQSPMAACTDLAFRLIAREKGLGFAYLEMVSAEALVRRNAKTLDLLKTAPQDRPLGAQLMGCEPGRMAEAAVILESMGFDLVDINLGCPAPKVTGGGDGAGSALLRRPQSAESIFQAVVRAVKNIPVTVKMRLGYEDSSGKEAVEIAKRAQDSGIAAVAVHGRTRAQKYTGRADYKAIGRVKSAVRIPVIGNGDVKSSLDAKRLLSESGCDAVMIGRGALGNPWLYRNIERFLDDPRTPLHIPTLAERRDTLLRHFELELEHQGERLAVLLARRIGPWYTAGLTNGASARAAFCRACSPAQIRDLIESAFDAGGESGAIEGLGSCRGPKPTVGVV